MDIENPETPDDVPSGLVVAMMIGGLLAAVAGLVFYVLAMIELVKMFMRSGGSVGPPVIAAVLLVTALALLVGARKLREKGRGR